jgi:hypothetical protein
MWLSGARPKDEPAPKLAREREYGRVVRLLEQSPERVFPTEMLARVAGGRTRQEVSGAMKLLVAARVAIHVVIRSDYVRGHTYSAWGSARSGIWNWN